MRLHVLLSLSAATALAACAYDWTLPPGGSGGGGGGGASTTTSASSSGATSTSTSGTMGTSSSSGTPAPACPDPDAPTPAPGDACSPDGLVCEYGKDPRVACRTLDQCKGTWIVTKPDPTACKLLDCPPAPAGTMCPNDGSFCADKDGSACYCTAMGPPVLLWYCAPTPDGACPAGGFPSIGQTCTIDAVPCYYGQCLYGTRVGRVCMGGVWQGVPNDC